VAFKVGEGWRAYSVGPRGLKSIQTSSIFLNDFKNCSNFDQSKKEIPDLQKFGIKYGFEEFRGRNNFLHINFFRFEMDVK
jgi:hypothetical protein